MGVDGKLTVVVSYGPTNDALDESKDGFYRALNSVAKDMTWHDKACFL